MADAASPPYCDLVLEGGVTSALIYAGLIARLSRHYRFKRLGGTSSGAAAAAAGAIAQRAELNALAAAGQTGAGTAGEPFEMLRQLPNRLAAVDDRGRTVLFRLFQPQAATARGFAVVSAMLQSGPGRHWDAAARACMAAVVQFPLAGALGALPGLWLIAGATHPWPAAGAVGPGSLADAVSLVLGVAVLLVLGVAVPLLWGAWVTLGGLRRNHFGLCSGMAGTSGNDDEPLTGMLHQLFNGLFGRTAQQPPVTFGDLWGSAVADGREVDLQVITTALNLRRPYRIPNDPGVDPLAGFYYDPSEWESLFPPAVTAWFAQWRTRGSGAQLGAGGTPLWPLPPPHAWPVLWAVRLSLGFPGLLSAIPMYCWERPQSGPASSGAGPHCGGSSDDVALIARKVYFSDGGITSNCPVHLFDAPLPGHPTFGVRLDTLITGEGGRHRVWLPEDTNASAAPPARPFGSGGRLNATGGFVASIVRTALDWRDSLQRGLPGYRERVVVVGLEPDEGGLNLAMAPRTIRRLGGLGARAGLRLLRAYARPQADGKGQAWNRHRWLRLRATLAAAQRFSGDVAERDAAQPRYEELLALQPSIEPVLVDAMATADAAALLERLTGLAAGSSGLPPRNLGDNAPQPTPRLRMSPPW